MKQKLNVYLVCILLQFFVYEVSYALTGADFQLCKRLAQVKEWRGAYILKGQGSETKSDVHSSQTDSYNTLISAKVRLINSTGLSEIASISPSSVDLACQMMPDDDWTSDLEITESTGSADWLITGVVNGDAYQFDWVAKNSIPINSFAQYASRLVFSFAQDNIKMPPPEVGHLASTVTYTASFRNETQDTEMVLGPTFEDKQPMLINFPPSATSLKISGTRSRTAGIEMGIYADMASGSHPLYSFPAMGTWEETLELVPYFIDGSSEKPTKSEIEDPCIAKGSIIGCENQSLGEAVDLVGIPYRLHYQSSRSLGYNGASTAAIDHTQHLAGWSLNVNHHYDVTNNVLYLGDGSIRNASSLGQVTASSDGGYLIASDDGQQVFKFDAAGQHTSTLNAFTGATVLTFGYNPAGLLIAVTDGDNQTTTFNRNARGGLVSIVSPYGVVTKITLNKAGYIAAITNPAGKSHKAKYDAKGLMTSFADPRGMISTFTYDALGRLVADKNAAGGKQTLLATSDDNSITVNRSTALGRVTSYQHITSVDGSSERKIVEPAGLITTIVKPDDASQSISASNGVLQALDFTDDSRFGASAAVLTNQTITMPSGKALSLNASRTATLSDQNDVMTLTQQLETFSLNGKTFNREYLQSNRTFTETSPEGRKTLITVDAQGRVIAEQVAGLHGVSYSYDAKGRLSTVSMGEGGDQRQIQYGYDAKGFLQSVTDPMGGVTSVLRDKAGQAIKMQLPGQRQQKFSFDAAGNLLSYTNPANKVYKYSHSKTGQVNKIVFPKAKGSKTTESAIFNIEGDVVSAIQMSGLKQNYAYDNAGRLTSLSSSAGSWQYAYNQSLGYLSSITGPDGVALSYSRDGDLITGMSWSGAVSGSVGLAHNTDFLLQEVSVNGVSPIQYSYDQDGVLQSVGSFTLSHSNQNTLLTATTLANVSDSYSYTVFGEVSHYQARFNSEILLTEDYSYDKLGRIIERREKFQADPEQVFTYSYDNAGQLSVVKEGQNTVNYSYDKNGNRINTAASNGAIAASYDAQDRLLNFGAAKFTYSGNGETLSRSEGAQVSRFEYNALGNLQAVLLPTGRIDYLLDGAGQRVGKKVANVLVQQFLYQDHLQPVAELDGRGNLVSRFIYATRSNVPDYMLKSGVTYRILTDHLGSVRLVVNAATGVVEQRLDYDELGRVISDSAPGFQPFGFAGGLYDVDTQISHFGARDYDAQIGRWLERDPIGFESGATNLYTYAYNDPINFIDSNGLAGVRAGGTVYINSIDVRLLPGPDANSLGKSPVINLQVGEKVTWLGHIPGTGFHKIGIIRTGPTGDTCVAYEGYVLQSNLSTKKPQMDFNETDGQPVSPQAFHSSGVGTKG